jgi:hypothetical protein
MIKILAALAVTVMIGSNPAKAQPSEILYQEYTTISQTTISNARPQRKFASPVKLATKHLPLHRVFADDDDDDHWFVEHVMHHRREIGFALVESESDAISDSVALRLWLIRQQALRAHQRCWG